MSLSVADLDKMRIEFPDIYETMHKEGHDRLRMELKVKKREIKACEQQKNGATSKIA